VRVNVQRATRQRGLPRNADFVRWANAALVGAGIPLNACSCVTIRLVDEAESESLNGAFRKIHKPTNVLAFEGTGICAANDGDETELGDLVICAGVVLKEAHDQAKTAMAHFAHMTVHGCLHLAGYDHIDDAQAAGMERLEQQLMAELGFPDPYNDASDAAGMTKLQGN
jgi:probable rRNA maturation factor